jgi:FtsZ-binding cell division protein ZapB
VTEENKGLAAMLHSLVAMESAMDNTDEEITLEQCEAHFAQFKSVQEKTDRLLGYMDQCKVAAAQLAERAQQLKEESVRWESRLKWLENFAMYCLTKYPNLAGSDFAIKKVENQPSMICNHQKKKQFTRYIPDESVVLIPREYLEEVKIWLLKTDEVKRDLKAGKDLDFAHLEVGERLVIKPKLRELKR